MFTKEEVQSMLREQVAAAGGAKNWMRKHRAMNIAPEHMIENGSAATLERVLPLIGMVAVTLYKPINE